MSTITKPILLDETGQQIVDAINRIGGDCVHYVEDLNKTDAQKAQARENIGAGSNVKLTEVESIAKGAQVAISYSNYSAFVTAFNALASTTYKSGQNIMIVTLEVPDLWIMSVETTSVPYTYTDDATIVNALNTTGYFQVGYYKIAALETAKVNLEKYLRVDSSQNFSSAEKTQGRTNIGAEKSYTTKTTMDATAEAKTMYFLGTPASISFALPSSANGGDEFAVVWYNGDTAVTPTITAASGTLVPYTFTAHADTRCELNALYDGSKWSVMIAEQFTS